MGIDVSKGYADFQILDAKKQSMDDAFQLDDTASGHHALTTYLKEFFQLYPNARLFAAVESTGGYENNWFRTLKACAERFPIHVARINPAWIKYNSQASGRRTRNDPISAEDIARYQIEHPEKINYDEDDYPELRRQWTLIQLLIKQKTQLLNQFGANLYDTMPELMVFCKKGTPQWIVHLVLRYPNYDAIQKAGEKNLSKIPFMSKKNLQQVLKLVEHGIGTCNQTSTHVLQRLAEKILEYNMLIHQQKVFLAKTYQQYRGIKDKIELLLSFKGIGVYSAVGLLLNIVDIRRFPNVKKLAAYFGLHPVYKQSGDGIKEVRMSKQGRAEARALLFMIALNSIRHNPLIRDVYQRHLAKGMHSYAAIGACMHKILRIVYGMLKTNTPFDPQIDRKNQQKSKTKKKKNTNNKARRLQPFDQNAPISQRQDKKRKEQASSQDRNSVKRGIKQPAPSEPNLRTTT